MPEHDPGEAGRKRMNKKKLPKAVLRTADEMRDAAADRAQDAPHRVDLNEPAGARPANVRTSADNVIEMMPKQDTAAAQPPDRAPDAAAALRRRRAVASSSATPTGRLLAAPFRFRLPMPPPSRP